MTEVIPFDPKTMAMAAKRAMADEPVPQDTLLPLLDAPLDDLATYLAPDSWEARKSYLANMMQDSIQNLMKQLEVFKEHGTSKAACRYVMDGCMVGLHIKIGQLLNAWGATEPADKHAAALFVLSASSEHRIALAKWMPDGCTSPPMEDELFEPGHSLMAFSRMSRATRPGLERSKCFAQRKAEGRERIRWWIKTRRAQDAAKEAAGMPEAEALLESNHERVDAIEDRLWDTPAETMRGVEIRLREACRDYIAVQCCDGEEDFYADAFGKVLADLERLAGEARTDCAARAQ